MAQVTASNIRIQRSASWASVAPGGTSVLQLVDRGEGVVKVVAQAAERFAGVERLRRAG